MMRVSVERRRRTLRVWVMRLMEEMRRLWSIERKDLGQDLWIDVTRERDR